MAIETAGKKPVTARRIKIENKSTIDLPKNWEDTINDALNHLPTEHRRGLDHLRIVDFIDNPQVRKMDVPIKGDLPGLYHPKVQTKSAWIEVSAGAIMQPTEGFFKRFVARNSFKSNMSSLLFSLVGQHYYLTMKHSVKKQNLEGQIRSYTQTNLRNWSEKQSENSLRGRMFKPFRPAIERWAKWLNKKAAKNK